ncbi:septation protein SepH [Micrococcoides hystricis]|uniref:Septation protein SepH n=1 Tax=Micrococcoides hystricis TaxID=1572761 RepID=A0ABV6P913_9MICC
MQQLKLVGPQDGHTNLILEAPDGTQFLLPADAELLTAAQQAQVPPPPPAKVPTEHIPEELTPRQIQTRIREGASVDDLVYASNMGEQAILRYAQPVLDERAYMVQLAQRVQVADEQPDAHRYPSYHSEPATLLDMLNYQLRSLQIPLDSVQWDAWRDPHGTWQIKASFDRPSQSYLFADEEPEARWYFEPAAKQLENANQWARVLSEDEPLDTPVAGHRLSAVSDADVQAGVANPHEDHDGLLDLLRERRGTRLGSDEESDDELAGYIARGFDPMDEDEENEDTFGLPRPEESNIGVSRGLVRHIDFGNYDQPEQDDVPAPVPAAKKHGEVRGQTDALQAVADHEAEQRQAELDKQAHQQESADSPANDSATADADQESQQDKPAKKKPKRSSVPSWDEIVFGTRGE